VFGGAQLLLELDELLADRPVLALRCVELLLGAAAVFGAPFALELLLLGQCLARFLAHRTEPVLETTQRIGKPLALRLRSATRRVSHGPPSWANHLTATSCWRTLIFCSEVLLTEAVLKVSDGGYPRVTKITRGTGNTSVLLF